MNAVNQSFFGSRLKLARIMAGMSLQDLSNNLENEITKQSLHKYEQGLMNPTSEVLIEICRVLKVKPDYFLKRNILEITNVSFRKKSSLSKKTEDSVVEMARDYIERFFEIENVLGIQEAFVNPIKKIPVNNTADVESAANKLREAWNLGDDPVPGIVEMLELKGVRILLIDYTDAIDGISFNTSNGTPVLVINTNSKPVERVRFTVIHELAHLLLAFNNVILADDKQLEKYCHFFASCFLVPRSMLIRMIGGENRKYIEIRELISIKEYYGISLRAILHRLMEIGVITNLYYTKWMVYLSKQYGQKNEPGNYKGEEKQKLFGNLVNRALAEELISLSKGSALLNISINNLRKDIENGK